MPKQVTLLLDKSGSMRTEDTRLGSRWKYAEETISALAYDVNELDPDGITVIPFSTAPFTVYENTVPATVANIFKEQRPGGSTDTAGALQKALDRYFARKQAAAGAAIDPELIIVMTDGVPDDQQAVAKVISNATKRLDRDDEVGITFIQVGADAAATKFLKSLDDDLVAAGASFDIVDTLLIDEVSHLSIEELVDRAFND
ncbi:MAG TPA: VWA domain-containing protein [Candidatus Obscuribacterales bacterium]